MVRALQWYAGTAIVPDVGQGNDLGASWEVTKNAERHRKEPATDVQTSIGSLLGYHLQDHLVRLPERLEQGLFGGRFIQRAALRGVVCWLTAP